MIKKTLNKIKQGVVNKQVDVIMWGLQKAEKEQTNTLMGIIFILAIAIAVGTIFAIFFPELAGQIRDFIQGAFSSMVEGQGLPSM